MKDAESLLQEFLLALLYSTLLSRDLLARVEYLWSRGTWAHQGQAAGAARTNGRALSGQRRAAYRYVANQECARRQRLLASFTH